MPIYVFRCDDCGEQFDRLQKLSDPDPDRCPHCGKFHVRRQVTAPAFRLAGSGWYETDFKSAREHRHNLAGDAGQPKASADKPEASGKQDAAARPSTNGDKPGSSGKHDAAAKPAGNKPAAAAGA